MAHHFDSQLGAAKPEPKPSPPSPLPTEAAATHPRRCSWKSPPPHAFLSCTCPSTLRPPPPLLRTLPPRRHPHAPLPTHAPRRQRRPPPAMLTTPTSSKKTRKAARRRDDEETKGSALVSSKESGEPDLQENTNPTHQGRSKKKESAKKKERGKKRISSALDSTNDTANEEISEYNLDEPTMEEKLATLNLINKDNEEQPLFMAPPSADSVHILLKQALRADDNVSLLNCLYNRDEKVIFKSISLLTPADVVKLLKFFVLQIQSRGAVLVCLLPWLQTLLSRHMSSIVSQESSLLLLNSLYQLIDARTSTFKSAHQLSTTLDYLFSEVADDEADDEEAAPPIIYEDKDTDEEEFEVDAMETDEEAEELGDVTDASEHSDGSEIISN
ncbi:proline-rich receptor-like protein kinase PERK10 [Phragmites australis]|uniref:proline-rich receptor-like protein kinase PERK10 n=1 Tax=Phragmites australis TaxID=29695 RepID=UPI002D785AB9|nr:proline-rich receptor-like protein kinase PERK10 [Phragmites australis]